MEREEDDDISEDIGVKEEDETREETGVDAADEALAGGEEEAAGVVWEVTTVGVMGETEAGVCAVEG